MSASNGWSTVTSRKRPIFHNTDMGIKASKHTQEISLKKANSHDAFPSASKEAFPSASKEAFPSASKEAFPSVSPQKTTAWSKSFSQTVIKMAANEAAERAAAEKIERDRRFDADLCAYIRGTQPTRSEFIEPLDDYSSSYSEEEPDDYTPLTEEEEDTIVDYRQYGSRRTFADV